MAKMIKTQVFRVSYPHIFKPTNFPGQEPKYAVTMLFPKTTDLKDLKALAKEAIEQKWPDPTKRPKDLKHPFRDGDVEKPDVTGYEGMVFIKASSLRKPPAFDENCQPLMSEDELYPGCYARALVQAFAYSTAGNNGVSFSLQGIQFVKDGEPFDGRPSDKDIQDAFDPIEGGDKGTSSVKPQVEKQNVEDMFK